MAETDGGYQRGDRPILLGPDTTLLAVAWAHPKGLRRKEIADRLHMHPDQVSRYLTQLEDASFIAERRTTHRPATLNLDHLPDIEARLAKIVGELNRASTLANVGLAVVRNLLPTPDSTGEMHIPQSEELPIEFGTGITNVFPDVESSED